MLSTLWEAANLGDAPSPLVPSLAQECEGIEESKSWRSLGFQNEDPTTDFRGVSCKHTLGIRIAIFVCNRTPGHLSAFLVADGIVGIGSTYLHGTRTT